MRDLMLLLLWTPLCLTTIAEPYLGVLIWTWAALVKPNGYLYGFMAGVPFDKVIAVLTLIMLLVKWNRRRLVVSGSTFLFGCLALVGLVSSVLSITPFMDPWVRYSYMLKVLVLCAVIENTIVGRVRIHSLILIIAVGLGLGTTLEAPKFLLSGTTRLVTGPWSSEDNNIFAVAVLMSLPVTLYLYSYSRAKAARIAFLAVTVFSVIALVGTSSRGGLIGLLAMCVYLVARSRRRMFTALVAVCVAGLCIWLVAPERWFERAGSIATAEQDASFEGRVTAWKVSALIARDRPLTGAGFDAVQDPMVWKRYASELPYPTAVQALASGMRAAHSIYFQALGDLGFPGLALLLLILVNGFTNAWAVSRAARGRPNLKWAADLAFALELSLVGYAVAGAGLSLAYSESFYVFVTILSTLRRSVQSELAAENSLAPSPGWLAARSGRAS